MCVRHLLFKRIFSKRVHALNVEVYFLDNACAVEASELLSFSLKDIPQSVVLRKVGNQLTFGGE